MKSSFDTLVLVGALGLGAWVVFGKGFGTIKNLGSIVESTTSDAARVSANTTRVVSNAVIAVENLPGSIINWIKSEATSARQNIINDISAIRNWF